MREVPSELREAPLKWEEHHQTYLGLQLSAELECYICGNIWNNLNVIDQILVSQPGSAGPVTSFQVQRNQGIFNILMRLNLPRDLQTLRGSNPSFEFFFQPLQGKLLHFPA